LNHCPSMHWSSVPPMLQMKCPCLARRTITLRYVKHCCVYLSVWVKVTVVLRSHLTQPIVRPVAGCVRPTAFLGDDLVKALKFLVIQ
jgi:hypothetical protein